jgi:hypothetical protein
MSKRYSSAKRDYRRNRLHWVIFSAFVFFLATLLAIIYFAGKVETLDNTIGITGNIPTKTNLVVNSNAATQGGSEPTSGWLMYRNERYDYQVMYPAGATYRELSSGIKEKNDTGYIVDFTLDDLVIRVYSYQNKYDARDLQALINTGAPLFVDDQGKFTEQNVRGKRTWKFYNDLSTDFGLKNIGVTTILVAKKFYYQITTGNQFSPGFTSEREMIYDKFISTFDALPD